VLQASSAPKPGIEGAQVVALRVSNEEPTVLYMVTRTSTISKSAHGAATPLGVHGDACP
jgi:hypothetical protein